MRIEATIWERVEKDEQKPEPLNIVPLADGDSVMLTIGIEDPEDPYSGRSITVSMRELKAALERVGWFEAGHGNLHSAEPAAKKS